VATNLQPQERKRGWFHATVYDARIELQGTFLVPDESRLRDLANDRNGQFLWNESFVAFGTGGNLAGFRSDDHIAISGTDTSWQPCPEVIHDQRACGGASLILAKAPVDTLQPAGTVAFKLSASLRGTTSFNVLFGGKRPRRHHPVVLADAKLSRRHPSSHLDRDRGRLRRPLADYGI